MGETTDEKAERLRKLNEDLAKDSWKAHRDAINATTNHAIQFGTVTLSGLMAVNGAATGAVAALVASNSAKMASVPQETTQAFTLFAVGFVLSLLAAGGAYCSQFFYAVGARQVEYTFEHPYVNEKPQRYVATGQVLHGLVVAIAVLSILCLSCGLLGLRSAFRTLLSQDPPASVVNCSCPTSTATAVGWNCAEIGTGAVACWKREMMQSPVPK